MTRIKTDLLPPFPYGILSLMLLAAVSACGGGSGSDSDGGGGPQPPDTSHPSDVEPITVMPSSSYTGTKLAAFTRLNEARIAAGVSAVKQNAQLDAAAQGHAFYLANNYLSGHYQNSSRPHFTGVTPSDRAKAHGYSGTFVTEIIEYALDVDPGVLIERHLNSVYHLAAALNPRANEIGIGRESTQVPAFYVANPISLGSKATTLKPVNSVWVWPTDGANNVPSSFKPVEERPNPLPDIASDSNSSVGQPVMFCGAHGNYAAIEVHTLSFKRERDPKVLDIRLLHHADVKVPVSPGIENVIDANIVNDFPSLKSCIFLITKLPLDRNANYVVSVSASQAGTQIGKTWTFTTSP